MVKRVRVRGMVKRVRVRGTSKSKRYGKESKKGMVRSRGRSKKVQRCQADPFAPLPYLNLEVILIRKDTPSNLKIVRVRGRGK